MTSADIGSMSQGIAHLRADANRQAILRAIGLDITPNIGRVEEIYLHPQSFVALSSQNTSKKFVYLIEDAHGVFQSQLNASKLINYLAKEKKVKLVGVEGSFGPVDTSFFNSFPRQETKKRVFKRHLHQARISGPEYYSVTGEKEIELHGVDHNQLYAKNVKAYLNTFEMREQMLAWVDQWHRDIIAQRNQHLSEEVLTHLKNKEKWQGTISWLQYLVLKSAQLGFDDEQLGALNRFFEKEGKLDSIEWNELITSLNKLDTLITQRLAKKEDRAYLDTEELLSQLKGLFSLHLSYDQHEMLRNSLRKWNPDRLGESLASVLKSTGKAPNASDLHDLFNNIEQTVDFYVLSRERDAYMVKHVNAEMDRQNENNSIVFVGGFHRHGISAELRELGISYVILRPAIEQLGAIDRYRTKMANYAKFNVNKERWMVRRDNQPTQDHVQLISQIAVIDTTDHSFNNQGLVNTFLSDTVNAYMRDVNVADRKELIREWSRRYKDGFIILRQEEGQERLYYIEREKIRKSFIDFLRQNTSVDTLQGLVKELMQIVSIGIRQTDETDNAMLRLAEIEDAMLTEKHEILLQGSEERYKFHEQAEAALQGHRDAYPKAHQQLIRLLQKKLERTAVTDRLARHILSLVIEYRAFGQLQIQVTEDWEKTSFLKALSQELDMLIAAYPQAYPEELFGRKGDEKYQGFDLNREWQLTRVAFRFDHEGFETAAARKRGGGKGGSGKKTVASVLSHDDRDAFQKAIDFLKKKQGTIGHHPGDLSAAVEFQKEGVAEILWNFKNAFPADVESRRKAIKALEPDKRWAYFQFRFHYIWMYVNAGWDDAWHKKNLAMLEQDRDDLAAILPDLEGDMYIEELQKINGQQTTFANLIQYKFLAFPVISTYNRLEGSESLIEPLQQAKVYLDKAWEGRDDLYEIDWTAMANAYTTYAVVMSGLLSDHRDEDNVEILKNNYWPAVKNVKMAVARYPRNIEFQIERLSILARILSRTIFQFLKIYEVSDVADSVERAKQAATHVSEIDNDFASVMSGFNESLANLSNSDVLGRWMADLGNYDVVNQVQGLFYSSSELAKEYAALSEQLVGQFPEDPRPLVKLIEMQFMSQNYEAALENLRKLFPLFYKFTGGEFYLDQIVATFLTSMSPQAYDPSEVFDFYLQQPDTKRVVHGDEATRKEAETITQRAYDRLGHVRIGFLQAMQLNRNQFDSDYVIEQVKRSRDEAKRALEGADKDILTADEASALSNRTANATAILYHADALPAEEKGSYESLISKMEKLNEAASVLTAKEIKSKGKITEKTYEADTKMQDAHTVMDQVLPYLMGWYSYLSQENRKKVREAIQHYARLSSRIGFHGDAFDMTEKALEKFYGHERIILLEILADIYDDVGDMFKEDRGDKDDEVLGYFQKAVDYMQDAFELLEVFSIDEGEDYRRLLNKVFEQYRKLAEVLYARKEYSEAIGYFKAAIRIAKIYLGVETNERILARFRHDLGRVHYLLGETYYDDDKVEEAREQWDKARSTLEELKNDKEHSVQARLQLVRTLQSITVSQIRQFRKKLSETEDREQAVEAFVQVDFFAPVIEKIRSHDDKELEEFIENFLTNPSSEQRRVELEAAVFRRANALRDTEPLLTEVLNYPKEHKEYGQRLKAMSTLVNAYTFDARFEQAAEMMRTLLQQGRIYRFLVFKGALKDKWLEPEEYKLLLKEILSLSDSVSDPAEVDAVLDGKSKDEIEKITEGVLVPLVAVLRDDEVKVNREELAQVVKQLESEASAQNQTKENENIKKNARNLLILLEAFEKDELREMIQSVLDELNGKVVRERKKLQKKKSSAGAKDVKLADKVLAPLKRLLDLYVLQIDEESELAVFEGLSEKAVMKVPAVIELFAKLREKILDRQSISGEGVFKVGDWKLSFSIHSSTRGRKKIVFHIELDTFQELYKRMWALEPAIKKAFEGWGIDQLDLEATEFDDAENKLEESDQKILMMKLEEIRKEMYWQSQLRETYQPAAHGKAVKSGPVILRMTRREREIETPIYQTVESEVQAEEREERRESVETLASRLARGWGVLPPAEQEAPPVEEKPVPEKKKQPEKEIIGYETKKAVELVAEAIKSDTTNGEDDTNERSSGRFVVDLKRWNVRLDQKGRQDVLEQLLRVVIKEAKRQKRQRVTFESSVPEAMLQPLMRAHRGQRLPSGKIRIYFNYDEPSDPPTGESAEEIDLLGGMDHQQWIDTARQLIEKNRPRQARSLKVYHIAKDLINLDGNLDKQARLDDLAHVTESAIGREAIVIAKLLDEVSIHKKIMQKTFEIIISLERREDWRFMMVGLYSQARKAIAKLRALSENPDASGKMNEDVQREIKYIESIKEELLELTGYDDTNDPSTQIYSIAQKSKSAIEMFHKANEGNSGRTAKIASLNKAAEIVWSSLDNLEAVEADFNGELDESQRSELARIRHDLESLIEHLQLSPDVKAYRVSGQTALISLISGGAVEGRVRTPGNRVLTDEQMRELEAPTVDLTKAFNVEQIRRNIRRLRKARELRQRDLADKSALTWAQIQHLEAFDTRAMQKTEWLEMVASGLGMTLNQVGSNAWVAAHISILKDRQKREKIKEERFKRNVLAIVEQTALTYSQLARLLNEQGIEMTANLLRTIIIGTAPFRPELFVGVARALGLRRAELTAKAPPLETVSESLEQWADESRDEMYMRAKIVGENIRWLRLSRGLSGEQLQQETGLPERAIERAEQGRRGSWSEKHHGTLAQFFSIPQEGLYEENRFFGTFLKAARAKRKLSVQQVAKETGVSTKILNRIEKAEKIVPADQKRIQQLRTYLRGKGVFETARSMRVEVADPQAKEELPVWSRNLAFLRQRQRLSQGELGVKLGYRDQRSGQTVVSLFERGKRMPSEDQLVKLCRILKINKDEIFGPRIEGDSLLQEGFIDRIEWTAKRKSQFQRNLRYLMNLKTESNAEVKRQLAEFADVRLMTVQTWFGSKPRVGSKSLEKIADFFNVTPQQMLDENLRQASSSEPLQAIAAGVGAFIAGWLGVGPFFSETIYALTGGTLILSGIWGIASNLRRGPPSEWNEPIAYFDTWNRWRDNVVYAFFSLRLNKLFHLLTHEPFHTIIKSEVITSVLQILSTATIISIIACAWGYSEAPQFVVSIVTTVKNILPWQDIVTAVSMTPIVVGMVRSGNGSDGKDDQPKKKKRKKLKKGELPRDVEKTLEFMREFDITVDQIVDRSKSDKDHVELVLSGELKVGRTGIAEVRAVVNAIVAEQISALRKLAEISGEEVARRAGINPSTQRQIETGKRSTTIETTRKYIAEINKEKAKVDAEKANPELNPQRWLTNLILEGLTYDPRTQRFSDDPYGKFKVFLDNLKKYRNAEYQYVVTSGKSRSAYIYAKTMYGEGRQPIRFTNLEPSSSFTVIPSYESGEGMILYLVPESKGKAHVFRISEWPLIADAISDAKTKSRKASVDPEVVTRVDGTLEEAEQFVRGGSAGLPWTTTVIATLAQSFFVEHGVVDSRTVRDKHSALSGAIQRNPEFSWKDLAQRVKTGFLGEPIDLDGDFFQSTATKLVSLDATELKIKLQQYTEKLKVFPDDILVALKVLAYARRLLEQEDGNDKELTLVMDAVADIKTFFKALISNESGAFARKKKGGTAEPVPAVTLATSNSFDDGGDLFDQLRAVRIGERDSLASIAERLKMIREEVGLSFADVLEKLPFIKQLEEQQHYPNAIELRDIVNSYNEIAAERLGKTLQESHIVQGRDLDEALLDQNVTLRERLNVLALSTGLAWEDLAERLNVRPTDLRFDPKGYAEVFHRNGTIWSDIKFLSQFSQIIQRTAKTSLRIDSILFQTGTVFLNAVNEIEKVHNQVRMIRELVGLYQADMAANIGETGMNRNFYLRKENGHRPFTEVELKSVLVVLKDMTPYQGKVVKKGDKLHLKIALQKRSIMTDDPNVTRTLADVDVYKRLSRIKRPIDRLNLILTEANLPRMTAIPHYPRELKRLVKQAGEILSKDFQVSHVMHGKSLLEAIAAVGAPKSKTHPQPKWEDKKLFGKRLEILMQEAALWNEELKPVVANASAFLNGKSIPRPAQIVEIVRFFNKILRKELGDTLLEPAHLLTGVDLPTALHNQNYAQHDRLYLLSVTAGIPFESMAEKVGVTYGVYWRYLRGKIRLEYPNQLKKIAVILQAEVRGVMQRLAKEQQGIEFDQERYAVDTLLLKRGSDLETMLPNEASLAEQIILLRTHLGQLQPDFAKVIGVSPQQYNGRERHDVPFTVDDVQKIADEFKRIDGREMRLLLGWNDSVHHVYLHDPVAIKSSEHTAFTEQLKEIPDELARLNTILNYAGLEPVNSMPDEHGVYALLGQVAEQTHFYLPVSYVYYGLDLVSSFAQIHKHWREKSHQYAVGKSFQLLRIVSGLSAESLTKIVPELEDFEKGLAAVDSHLLQKLYEKIESRISVILPEVELEISHLLQGDRVEKTASASNALEAHERIQLLIDASGRNRRQIARETRLGSTVIWRLTNQRVSYDIQPEKLKTLCAVLNKYVNLAQPIDPVYLVTGMFLDEKLLAASDIREQIRDILFSQAISEDSTEELFGITKEEFKDMMSGKKPVTGSVLGKIRARFPQLQGLDLLLTVLPGGRTPWFILGEVGNLSEERASEIAVTSMHSSDRVRKSEKVLELRVEINMLSDRIKYPVASLARDTGFKEQYVTRLLENAEIIDTLSDLETLRKALLPPIAQFVKSRLDSFELTKSEVITVSGVSDATLKNILAGKKAGGNTTLKALDGLNSIINRAGHRLEAAINQIRENWPLRLAMTVKLRHRLELLRGQLDGEETGEQDISQLRELFKRRAELIREWGNGQAITISPLTVLEIKMVEAIISESGIDVVEAALDQLGVSNGAAAAMAEDIAGQLTVKAIATIDAVIIEEEKKVVELLAQGVAKRAGIAAYLGLTLEDLALIMVSIEAKTSTSLMIRGPSKDRRMVEEWQRITGKQLADAESLAEKAGQRRISVNDVFFGSAPERNAFLSQINEMPDFLQQIKLIVKVLGLTPVKIAILTKGSYSRLDAERALSGKIKLRKGLYEQVIDEFERKTGLFVNFSLKNGTGKTYESLEVFTPSQIRQRIQVVDIPALYRERLQAVGPQSRINHLFYLGSSGDYNLFPDSLEAGRQRFVNFPSYAMISFLAGLSESRLMDITDKHVIATEEELARIEAAFGYYFNIDDGFLTQAPTSDVIMPRPANGNGLKLSPERLAAVMGLLDRWIHTEGKIMEQSEEQQRVTGTSGNGNGNGKSAQPGNGADDAGSNGSSAHDGLPVVLLSEGNADRRFAQGEHYGFDDELTGGESDGDDDVELVSLDEVDESDLGSDNPFGEISKETLRVGIPLAGVFAFVASIVFVLGQAAVMQSDFFLLAKFLAGIPAAGLWFTYSFWFPLFIALSHTDIALTEQDDEATVFHKLEDIFGINSPLAHLLTPTMAFHEELHRRGFGELGAYTLMILFSPITLLKGILHSFNPYLVYSLAQSQIDGLFTSAPRSTTSQTTMLNEVLPATNEVQPGISLRTPSRQQAGREKDSDDEKDLARWILSPHIKEPLPNSLVKQVGQKGRLTLSGLGQYSVAADAKEVMLCPAIVNGKKVLGLHYRTGKKSNWRLSQTLHTLKRPVVRSQSATKLKPNRALFANHPIEGIDALNSRSISDLIQDSYLVFTDSESNERLGYFAITGSRAAFIGLYDVISIIAKSNSRRPDEVKVIGMPISVVGRVDSAGLVSPKGKGSHGSKDGRVKITMPYSSRRVEEEDPLKSTPLAYASLMIKKGKGSNFYVLRAAVQYDGFEDKYREELSASLQTLPPAEWVSLSTKENMGKGVGIYVLGHLFKSDPTSDDQVSIRRAENREEVFKVRVERKNTDGQIATTMEYTAEQIEQLMLRGLKAGFRHKARFKTISGSDVFEQSYYDKAPPLPRDFTGRIDGIRVTAEREGRIYVEGEMLVVDGDLHVGDVVSVRFQDKRVVAVTKMGADAADDQTLEFQTRVYLEGEEFHSKLLLAMKRRLSLNKAKKLSVSGKNILRVEGVSTSVLSNSTNNTPTLHLLNREFVLRDGQGIADVVVWTDSNLIIIMSDDDYNSLLPDPVIYVGTLTGSAKGEAVKLERVLLSQMTYLEAREVGAAVQKRLQTNIKFDDRADDERKLIDRMKLEGASLRQVLLAWRKTPLMDRYLLGPARVKTLYELSISDRKFDPLLDRNPNIEPLPRQLRKARIPKMYMDAMPNRDVNARIAYLFWLGVSEQEGLFVREKGDPLKGRVTPYPSLESIAYFSEMTVRRVLDIRVRKVIPSAREAHKLERAFMNYFVIPQGFLTQAPFPSADEIALKGASSVHDLAYLKRLLAEWWKLMDGKPVAESGKKKNEVRETDGAESSVDSDTDGGDGLIDGVEMVGLDDLAEAERAHWQFSTASIDQDGRKIAFLASSVSAMGILGLSQLGVFQDGQVIAGVWTLSIFAWNFILPFLKTKGINVNSTDSWQEALQKTKEAIQKPSLAMFIAPSIHFHEWLHRRGLGETGAYFWMIAAGPLPFFAGLIFVLMSIKEGDLSIGTYVPDQTRQGMGSPPRHLSLSADVPDLSPDAPQDGNNVISSASGSGTQGFDVDNVPEGRSSESSFEVEIPNVDGGSGEMSLDLELAQRLAEEAADELAIFTGQIRIMTESVLRELADSRAVQFNDNVHTFVFADAPKEDIYALLSKVGIYNQQYIVILPPVSGNIAQVTMVSQVRKYLKQFGYGNASSILFLTDPSDFQQTEYLLRGNNLYQVMSSAQVVQLVRNLSMDQEIAATFMQSA